jgi:hypothetical protein
VAPQGPRHERPACPPIRTDIWRPLNEKIPFQGELYTFRKARAAELGSAA